MELQAECRPASRAQVGAARLEARDNWNSYEFKIQEVFMKYDKDWSGALETEEFREFLQDFNEGREATEAELNFMMRLSDKNCDGKIELGELHFAIRAWHSYRNFDDSVLRRFSEFDTDHSGHIDPQELQALLEALNGGKAVPWSEVQFVITQGHGTGGGAINRSDLLGAIAAWYCHVDRQETAVQTLVQEAMTRTLKDGDYVDLLDQGMQGMGKATSMLLDQQGYLQVGEGIDDRSAPGASSEPDLNSRSLSQRLKKALPLLTRSCTQMCYIAFPFTFCTLLICLGWATHSDTCPKNLDGVMLWFGLLGFGASILVYVESTAVMLERARMAMVVMLAVLNITGFLWTTDGDVVDATCGHLLIYSSMCIWMGIPVVVMSLGCYFVASHVKDLQQKEQSLTHQLVL